ncbi:MAG TPA: Wzz/FepE/Etk N-terminal domain-containing protein [Rhizomicrobium sp.]|nr:Wzz/FepE/Etk N-terminal domain-containing protein [Rhizomicrobium sp.]
MDVARSDEQPESQIDIYTIIGPLLRVRFVIGLFMIVGLLVGVLLLHILPYSYQSIMLVTQAESESKNGFSGLLGDQAASLIGLTGGKGSQSPNFQLYIDGLKARVVADEVAQDQPLMRRLFSKEWDVENGAWHPPERGVLGMTTTFVKDMLGVPTVPWTAPNGARVAEFIDHQVSIEQDPTDPVAHISVITENPQLGRDLLRALDHAADDYLKRTFLARSTEYIQYLDKQLATVTGAELRQSLIDQMSDQQKIKMMASANASFAAQTFGRPYTLDVPASPKAGSVLAGMAVFGFLIAAAFGYSRLSVAARLENALRRPFGVSPADG